MTDTTRESVERLMQDCALAEKVMKDGDIFLTGQAIFADATKTLAALLTRAEAAEARAAREKVRGDNHWETLRSIRQIAKETGDLDRIIQWVNDAGQGYTETAEQTLSQEMDKRMTAEAERDALAAKLAVAVDAGEYLLRAFDAINDRPHRYRADDVFLMVKNGSRIASVYDARAALATRTPADAQAALDALLRAERVKALRDLRAKWIVRDLTEDDFIEKETGQ